MKNRQTSNRTMAIKTASDKIYKNGSECLSEYESTSRRAPTASSVALSEGGKRPLQTRIKTRSNYG